jgi:nitrate reductase (cytochrome), electron transfer subunit
MKLQLSRTGLSGDMTMKTLLVTILAISFISACAKAPTGGEVATPQAAIETTAVKSAPAYDDEGIGFRKETLFNEVGVEPPVATFTDVAPGSSDNMARAFSTAPPQIPHSTEGLLPIKKDNNACVACHLPAVAAAVKATSVPESHMEGAELSNARFSCSQCHVPQANVPIIVDNTF